MRAKNIIGWGSVSNNITIRADDVPA